MSKVTLAIVAVCFVIYIVLSQWTIHEWKSAARAWRATAATYQVAWVRDAKDGTWGELVPILVLP